MLNIMRILVLMLIIFINTVCEYVKRVLVLRVWRLEWSRDGTDDIEYNICAICKFSLLGRSHRMRKMSKTHIFLFR